MTSELVHRFMPWPLTVRTWLYDLPHNLRHDRMYRLYAAVMLMVFVLSLAATVWQPFLTVRPFHLSSAASALLTETNPAFAAVLKHDPLKQQYGYNQAYTPSASTGTDSGVGRPRIKASFPEDAAKGVTVTDPVNNLDVTVKPQFDLAVARQDKNRIIYSMDGGALVYSAQAANVKEDINRQSIYQKMF